MSQLTEAEIRLAMYRRGMRQRDLARMLGISDAYLSDIINGKKDGPKAQEKVEEIKAILGIKDIKE